MTRIPILIGLIIFAGVALARIGPALRESQERYNSQEKARRQHCAELSRIYSDDSVRVTFFAECIR